jgi:hypothetical protein
MNNMFVDIMGIVACAGYAQDVEPCKLACRDLSVVCGDPHSMFWRAIVNRPIHRRVCEIKFADPIPFTYHREVMVRRMDLNHARTRLFKAVMHNNVKFVRTFIQLGAAVNAKDDFGMTPLDYARHGSDDMVKELEAHGALSTRQTRPPPIQIPPIAL